MPIQQIGTVTVQGGGKTSRGTYWVSGGVVTVSFGRGSKSAKVGRRAVEAVASLLLAKLVSGGDV